MATSEQVSVDPDVEAEVSYDNVSGSIKYTPARKAGYRTYTALPDSFMYILKDLERSRQISLIVDAIRHAWWTGEIR